MKKVVITKKSESKFELAEIVREEEVCLNLDPKLLTEPLPRLNASMTIKDNCLYVMGGSLELGIKTIVFDDCWKFGIKTGRWENVRPRYHTPLLPDQPLLCLLTPSLYVFCLYHMPSLAGLERSLLDDTRQS